MKGNKREKNWLIDISDFAEDLIKTAEEMEKLSEGLGELAERIVSLLTELKDRIQASRKSYS